MKRIIFIFTLMASTLAFASERVDSIIGYEFTTWYESGTMNSNEWRVQDSVFVYDARLRRVPADRTRSRGC